MIEKLCKCGKLTKNKVYCSYACNNKYRNITYSKKRNLKISLSKRKENNPMWKGDKVGYAALHDWVRRQLSKPKFCQKCKKRKAYDLANISGKYLRDVKDYIWLCRKCHMTIDGRIIKVLNNLKQFQ